jgi:hypothetical protein
MFDHKKIWIIDLGWLTDFSHPATLHFENGLLFAGDDSVDLFLLER